MRKKLHRLLYPSAWLYFAVLAAFCALAAFVEQNLLLWIMLGVSAILLACYIVFRAARHRQLQDFLQEYVDRVSGVQGAEAPFPLVVFHLADGQIAHANDLFAKLTGLKSSFVEHRISDLFPEFTTDWLLSGKTEYPYDVTVGQHRYRVYGSVIRNIDPQISPLAILYLSELTELYQIRDEYIRSRPVVSIILVDNYDELTRNMTEAAISTLDAHLNNCIMQWAQDYHGLLRRMEKNRFLLVIEKRDLKHAVAQKFSLLENVHEITSPSGLEASISIGLGVDGETFEEAYDFAALSIEMALSRGGDQAVVKDRMNFHFYGGRAKEADRRGKVRSRVTANTLLELIAQSSQIFIMSHKNADMDSLGAAMGIACLCRKKDKPFHIVIDFEENSAQRLIDEIVKVSEYKNVFISGQDALLMCDNRSTLVVVDTNRPDQVECKPLLEAVPKICVVDHHLRAADYINPVELNFHEPYASSASELATELLEYGVEPKDVLPIEAKALMAGLILDSKSFNVRTGERTFEAAAYLRKMGADTVEVKKLLQNDYDDTIIKHKIIGAARMHKHGIAIAPLNGSTSRILAAQAADELLNITGIRASFVLFPDNDRVIISARSIGDANVQIILEELGGGGNSSTAGAQIPNTNVKEVLDKLVAAIDRYYESKQGE